MNGLPEPLASENKNENVGKTDQVLFLHFNLDMVASPISTTLICTLGIKVKKMSRCWEASSAAMNQFRGALS